MNILYIGREVPFPSDTGAKMRTGNIIKRLAARHNIYLICYGDKNTAEHDSLKAVCQEYVVIPPPREFMKNKGVALYWSVLKGLLSSRPLGVTSRFSPLMKEGIAGWLKEQSIDCIMCDTVYQAVYIPAGPCRTVLNEQNVESTIIRRYALLEKNLLKKAYAYYEYWRMARLEREIWGKMDCIFACSDTDKEAILAKVKTAKVEVIPNGVDVPDLLEDVREIPCSIVYTGLMSWHPNEDAVMYFVKDIYPLVKERVPEAAFWIVGKGPSEKLRQLCAGDASIHVTGFVETVTPYIMQSQVCAVPLRIGSGTRLKILEAMALKKAIVSTSIGCEGLEVTGHEDILIADDPQSFAGHIVDLLRDEDKRRQLAERGRGLVDKKYRWEVIGDKITAVIQALV